MHLYKLLGKEFKCNCGRAHKIPVRKLIYEKDAIKRIPETIKNIFNENIDNIVITADIRTWQVCGQEVYRSISNEGINTSQIIIEDPDRGAPVCDDLTCSQLKNKIKEIDPDLIIAVGSGTINDLCKWSSFQLDIPYIVVATAASMNGYSAINVAAQIDGVKFVIKTRPPLAVIAEPEVIENAPLEMTISGFSDTIAKPQSNTDWMMNHILFDEYYCPFCVEMLNNLESLYLNRPEDIKKAVPEAVKGLFEALFWTGIAMTIVGTSTPASGGEHLISHTLDMMSTIDGIAHDLHGRQVGLGVIFSAALYERLFEIDIPSFCQMPQDIDEQFWNLPALVQTVKKEYYSKKDIYEQAQARLSQPKIWQQLKEVLQPISKSSAQIKECLIHAGAAHTIKDIGCSRDRFKRAVLHTHEIRRRLTIIDLAWLTGIMPATIDDIIDQLLTV